MNMAHRLTADIRDDVESIVKELFSYRSPLSVFQATIAKASLPFYYKVLKECNLVIAATRGLASHYCKLLGKNVEIIYNGADFQHFRNLTSKERNERRGGIVIADLNAEYQKLDIIIRAIDILSKQDIELPFTIVGNGHYRRTYEDLCKRLDVKSVRFVGYVPYPNLPYLLRTASFGVVGRPIDKNVQLLSTLTNKFFEYIASGLPVFAYGSSGSEVEEFIQTYRLGTYVESNDPFVIATELRRFLSLNFNRKHLLNVAKEFDRTRWAKRLCELIERSL
jgi:glycosyltransferase involved in cell wall biosynthesis